MNKILNWLFGACFRTLGRFLAIFLVFALLLFVGSKLDLELPSWLGLRVNAKTSGYYISAMYKEPELNNQYSFNNKYGGYYSEILYETTDIKFYFNNIPVSLNEYIYVPITFYTTNASGEYVVSSNGIYNIEAGISVRALYSNGYMSSCYALEFNKNNNKIIYKCNINSGATNLNGFRIYINDIGLSGNYLEAISYIGVGDTLDLEVSSNNTIIQNQDQTNEKLDDVNQSIQDTNDTLNDDDTSGAQDSASGFFDNFNTETFGLTSIITAPLNAIKSLINSSCNNLVLPLPFVEKNLTLPCMNSIYSNYFKGFFDLYQIITTGLISYYIIVRIFNLVKDFKNPEHDEIEVMDL